MQGSHRQKSEELMARSLVWDAHSGFMPHPKADLNNLSIWRDAGVNYLSIDVGFDVLKWEDCIRTIAAFRKWIADHSDEYIIVHNVHDIHQAHRDGKLAITFDLEGANVLDGRVEMVELYHSLGCRQMLLAYNRNNLAAGGCHDEDSGLTYFGREVVDELNRLGMFVDLTHCGLKTTMDILEHTTRPVIYSHSNPRALWDHERNIADEQIKACAETGGLISVVGIGRFMGNDTSSARLADGICHIADLVGTDHVGIGLDYAFKVDVPEAHDILARHPEYWPLSQGYGGAPSTYVAPGQLVEVTEALLTRGMSERDVTGILGGNFLRLAAEIWR
ncbi:membrane dipeptidase [Pseudotabrizicola sp. 4114]|uniref:dipeptidase n=1 Tax=Pseudotabrizicola sp. 4114 TaxID=2817731 RepID=UPI0028665220|nr:membrane dipeptidase [Pseudorhodobacter sp. 4114]